ncbi:hypothetical protein V8G54_012963 [Vigna mungo]|uniref:Uncharacterized protein n=1 Tax=Vigna mungo TaxID=3915 RepID=A0AAQ3NV97_VIGMU
MSFGPRSDRNSTASCSSLDGTTSSEVAIAEQEITGRRCPNVEGGIVEVKKQVVYSVQRKGYPIRAFLRSSKATVSGYKVDVSGSSFSNNFHGRRIRIELLQQLRVSGSNLSKNFEGSRIRIDLLQQLPVSGSSQAAFLRSWYSFVSSSVLTFVNGSYGVSDVDEKDAGGVPVGGVLFALEEVTSWFLFTPSCFLRSRVGKNLKPTARLIKEFNQLEVKIFGFPVVVVDLYSGYVPMGYSDYLKKMSKSGEWGDHVTLQGEQELRQKLMDARFELETTKHLKTELFNQLKMAYQERDEARASSGITESDNSLSHGSPQVEFLFDSSTEVTNINAVNPFDKMCHLNQNLIQDFNFSAPHLSMIPSIKPLAMI